MMKRSLHLRRLPLMAIAMMALLLGIWSGLLRLGWLWSGIGTHLPLIHGEFIRESSDEEMVEFIKVGRQPDHPLNTTGVAMPPKGGNPAFSDEGIYDIVAWMRTLD
jgi:hypothetical protein